MDIFHILVRSTVMDCCGMATVTVMADKIARLTDIRVKNARSCGYPALYNGPTCILQNKVFYSLRYLFKYFLVPQ